MKKIMIPHTVIIDRSDLVDSIINTTIYNDNQLMNVFGRGSGIPVFEQSQGILYSTRFKIEKSSDLVVTVSPGVARFGEITCSIPETVSVEVRDMPDGTYPVYLSLNSSLKSIGVESFRAGVAESSTLKDYSVSVVLSLSEPLSPSINIGSVTIYGGRIPDDISYVSDKDYPHTETSIFSFIKNIPSWYDSTNMFARNGNEYIRVNGNSLERGQLRTAAFPVMNGSSIVFSPIIDKRHLFAINALPTKSFAPVATLSGNSVRVNVSPIKPKPSIPEVDIAGVQWVNRNVVTSLMTSNLRDLYRKSIGVQKTIDGLLTESSILNSRVLNSGGDDSVLASSARELKDIQVQIVRKQSELNAIRSALSADETESFLKYAQKKFKAKVSVSVIQTNATSSVEQLEIEVSYITLQTGSEDDKVYYYSPRKEPIEFNSYGEKIYGDDVPLWTFMVPIEIGQKIRVRARALLSDGTATLFSGYKDFSFAEYKGDVDYALSQDIQSVLVPEYSRYARIVSEAANVVESLTSNTLEINSQLVSLNNKVNILESVMKDNSIQIGYLSELIDRMEIKPIVTKEVALPVDNGSYSSEV